MPREDLTVSSLPGGTLHRNRRRKEIAGSSGNIEVEKSVIITSIFKKASHHGNGTEINAEFGGVDDVLVYGAYVWGFVEENAMWSLFNIFLAL